MLATPEATEDLQGTGLLWCTCSRKTMTASGELTLHIATLKSRSESAMSVCAFVVMLLLTIMYCAAVSQYWLTVLTTTIAASHLALQMEHCQCDILPSSEF